MFVSDLLLISHKEFSLFQMTTLKEVVHIKSQKMRTLKAAQRRKTKS